MNRQQRRAAMRKGATPPPSAPAAPDPAFARVAELHAAGHLAEAEPLLRQVLARNPRHADALHLLGLVELQAGRPGAAVPLIEKAVAAEGRHAPFHNNLGSAYRTLGRAEDAIAAFRQALAIRPDYERALINLLEMLGAAGQTAEAADTLRRLLQLRPDQPEQWVQLGYLLVHKPDLEGALDAYSQAVRLKPTLAQAYNGVANVLADLGRLEESVAAYRQCLRLDPDNREAHSNLLMTLHSLPGVSSAELLAEARAYGARLEPQPKRVFAHRPDPERALRIGYVSADFRVHPVGFFLDRVLPAHDPAEVEAMLYSDTLFPDEMSARLQAHAQWRNTVGKSHAEVLDAVQADGIDILVDLASHTGSNRLPLFALRAAPVQMAWLGYFGTTGLGAIDHVLADEIVLPPGEEPFFTETPLRLGAPYLCWSPPDTEVPLAPPPALARGHVTFGCFNNPRKITGQAIDAWAGIMNRVPGSRLLMKYWTYEDAACRARFLRAFAARGIDQDRLEFEGLEPRVRALEAYNRVDIALDPFPFGGCTTTADTLWMGVPVIGLVGDRWSGRMSLDILSSLGLRGWAAPDVQTYTDTAVGLTGDLSGLAALRRALRPRLEASAFCDGPGFTARLEGAYRAAWQAWCKGQAA